VRAFHSSRLGGHVPEVGYENRADGIEPGVVAKDRKQAEEDVRLGNKAEKGDRSKHDEQGAAVETCGRELGRECNPKDANQDVDDVVQVIDGKKPKEVPIAGAGIQMWRVERRRRTQHRNKAEDTYHQVEHAKNKRKEPRLGLTMLFVHFAFPLQTYSYSYCHKLRRSACYHGTIRRVFHGRSLSKEATIGSDYHPQCFGNTSDTPWQHGERTVKEMCSHTAKENFL